MTQTVSIRLDLNIFCQAFTYLCSTHLESKRSKDVGLGLELCLRCAAAGRLALVTYFSLELICSFLVEWLISTE